MKLCLFTSWKYYIFFLRTLKSLILIKGRNQMDILQTQLSIHDFKPGHLQTLFVNYLVPYNVWIMDACNLNINILLFSVRVPLFYHMGNAF